VSSDNDQNTCHFFCHYVIYVLFDWPLRTNLNDVPAVVEGREERVGALQPEAGVHVAVQKQEQLVEPIASAPTVEYHLQRESNT
jgi:hypothetical protein